MDITAAEVTALDAALPLASLGVIYVPLPGKDHGTLNVSAEAEDQVQTALTDLRSGSLKPKVATIYDFLGFLALFTPAEQAAIVNATDPRIKLFCLMAAGANYVDLTDARVVSGTQLLESQNLIGKGRAAQVLAGQLPPSA